MKCREGLAKETAQHSRGEEAQIYLRALPLKSLDDVKEVKEAVNKRFIIILRVTPLARQDIHALKSAVEQLYEFTVSIGGDIARLGEERIVITPPGVKIWRGLG
jgi:hypothetical protein